MIEEQFEQLTSTETTWVDREIVHSLEPDERRWVAGKYWSVFENEARYKHELNWKLISIRLEVEGASIHNEKDKWLPGVCLIAVGVVGVVFIVIYRLYSSVILVLCDVKLLTEKSGRQKWIHTETLTFERAKISIR